MSKSLYLSVQALTAYIKKKFDVDPHLRKVYVKGELSNVTHHTSGHLYFTLKDEKSRIRAVMFKMEANRLKFRPENGMKVLITGDVSVYEASGQYQLYANQMEPDGIGALYLAFEQLKEKLAEEGLFNEEWKSPLPYFPQTIGIVTASTGAAIQDIYSTISRRYPLAKMILFPATVQGKNAALSVAQAIEQANFYSELDVLIVGRGGGSIEDLWAFNEEVVARAIFSSRIPIISAVGHETDTTIADFVADRRAPTPTAAAELAVPAKEELMDRILDRKHALYRSFTYRVKQEQERLTALQNSYPLQFPERLYRPFIEKHLHLEERLKRNAENLTRRDEMTLNHMIGRLQQYSPANAIQHGKMELDGLTNRLITTTNYQVGRHQDRFTSTLRILTSLNPLQIIERGYSIVYREDEVQKSAEQLNKGDSLQIKMHDGIVNVTVESVRQEGNK